MDPGRGAVGDDTAGGYDERDRPRPLLHRVGRLCHGVHTAQHTPDVTARDQRPQGLARQSELLSLCLGEWCIQWHRAGRPEQET